LNNTRLYVFGVKLFYVYPTTDRITEFERIFHCGLFIKKKLTKVTKIARLTTKNDFSKNVYQDLFLGKDFKLR
jgi:hypothetical protein